MRRKQYQDAQHLAEHAHYLMSGLFCRDEWEEEMLLALSDAGLAEAAKIKAKRATPRGKPDKNQAHQI